MSFTYLHVRSYYSLLAGGSSPAALATRAARLGLEALAITDTDGTRGVVQFAKACSTAGIKPIYGTELSVEGFPVVLLCEDRAGYGQLCQLLTQSYQVPLTLDDLSAAAPRHLFCLTGGREGLLVGALRSSTTSARRLLDRLNIIFTDRLSAELWHHLHEKDPPLIRALTSWLPHAAWKPR